MQILKLANGRKFEVISCGASSFMLTIEVDAYKYASVDLLRIFSNEDNTRHIELYYDTVDEFEYTDPETGEKVIIPPTILTEYNNYVQLEDVLLIKGQNTSDGVKDIYKMTIRSVTEPNPAEPVYTRGESSEIDWSQWLQSQGWEPLESEGDEENVD